MQGLMLLVCAAVVHGVCCRRRITLSIGSEPYNNLRSSTNRVLAACAAPNRRFADASRLYVASEEERAADAAAAQKATLLSVAVIVGPLVVLAALVGTHSL